MKRLKQLLVIGLAVVMAFAFSACGKKDDTTTSKTLSSISVDSSAAKTEYTVGESFSSDGIVVTATYDDATTATIASGSYTVDSSAYKSSTVGTYSITVSYTESEVTKTSSYSVTVAEADVEETDTGYGGLYITKTTTDYTVSSDDGVTVSTDDLSVYLVDEDGNVSSTALSSGYTLKYYKEDVELESLSNLTEGKYQIWAYYANPYSDEPAQLSNFIFINVADTIASIALSNAETGTFTQIVGTTDLMSSTWEYTLTYASGVTETIKADDANLVVSGISTLTAVTDAEATVTYTKGTTEVSCTVKYSITQKSGKTTYTFSYDELTTAMFGDAAGTDKTALDAKYFTGSNAFITYCGTSASDVWRSSSCIEVKGEALQVTFLGTGTITISFGSNKAATESSAGNTSTLALKNESGSYLTATSYDTTGVTETAGTTVYYSASGSTAYDVTFTITEAGTYTICTNLGGEGRVARIHGITMTDVIGDDESDASAVSIDIADVATAMGATISGGTELVSGSGVYVCGSDVSYDLNSSSKAIYDSDAGAASETKLTYRLKFGGGVTLAEGATEYTTSTVSNALCIMTTDAATITVYVRSSNGSTSRVVALYDSTGTSLSTADVPTATSGDYVYKVTFTVSAAGTYFFGSTESGIGVYSLSISY